jgi:UDP-glucose 4-epimerase
MKVLVTGGNGLIGKAVINELLRNNLSVRSMDLSKNSTNNIENFIGSILDTNNVNEAVRGCDAIIHLAAKLGVKRTETHRLETLNLNIQGTVNILEAAVKNNIKKVIFTSSSEIYGDQSVDFISEECHRKPKSIYAVTKLASEEYMEAYNHYYGLNYSILRYFNVYGPGQVAEFVLPRFIKAAMDDIAPTIYGDGSQVRSFCYVDDIARGTVLTLLSEESNSQVFNLGNDKDKTTILEAANKVIEVSGRSLKPNLISFNEADRSTDREIRNRVPDISKARKILNYEPKIFLEEGIKRVLAAGKIHDSWIEPMGY